MSYYYDHEARKWRRNPVDDPYKSYREEEKAAPRTSYTATEPGDKPEQSEEDKRKELEQHLRNISHLSRKPRKTYRKICEECKKDFQAHKDSKRYCSPRCTLRHWRKHIK